MKLSLLIPSFLFATALSAQLIVLEGPPMNEIRSGHASANIDETRVLACGGFNNIINLNTSEIYNTTTSGWEVGPLMLETRYTHTASSLGDGRVLVTGGWDGGSINHASTEIFVAGIDEFIEGPEMVTGRSDHQATELEDGRILITGGYNGIENTALCEIFDPSDDSMTPVASMNYGRSMHTATLLQDGRVLVTGGYNPDYGFQMVQCEIYDPVNDTWTETASLNVPRDNHGAVLMGNGQVRVIGGRYFDGMNGNYAGLTSTEVFNANDGIWGFGPPTLSGHSYIKPFTYDSPWGYISVVLPGGTDISGIGFDLTLSESEVYEGDLEDWITLADYQGNPLNSEGRFRYAIALIHPQAMMLCGGNTGEIGTSLIYSNSVISVEEPLGSIEMRIYPNPTQQSLNFSSSSPVHSWSIIGMDGKTVDSEQINEGSLATSIELNDLPAGYYILELATKQGLIRRTFIRD